MELEVKLHNTVENLLNVILRMPVAGLELLTRKDNQVLLFRDLLQLGSDFFELLRIFVNAGSVDERLCDVILSTQVPTDCVGQLTLSSINTLMPHWTSSKYHTASKREVAKDILNKVFSTHTGCFVYNSNANVRSSRAYNDLYVLIVSEEKNFFIDINRRKIHGLLSEISYNEIEKGSE